MQGETNESLISNRHSPHDSDLETYREDSEQCENDFPLQTESYRDGVSGRGDENRYSDKEESPKLDVPTEACGRDSHSLCSEPGENVSDYENGNNNQKPQSLEPIYDQLYVEPGHALLGSGAYKTAPDAHGPYPDIHSVGGGGSGYHGMQQIQSASWMCQYGGGRGIFSGCDEHTYPHGYFIMPYFGAGSYPYSHVPFCKPVPSGSVLESVYTEAVPSIEQVPLMPYGFPHAETGRTPQRLPASGNLVMSQTEATTFGGHEGSPARSQALPPIWPSFAERVPEPNKDARENFQAPKIQPTLPKEETEGLNQFSSPYVYLRSDRSSDAGIVSSNRCQGTKKPRKREGSNYKTVKASKNVPHNGQRSSSDEFHLLPSTCKWIVRIESTDEEAVCNRHFLSAVDLAKHLSSDHIYRHESHMTYVCKWENCQRQNKPFKARYKLVNHLRVHTGERPYICRHPGCERAFARTENLKIHARGHSGEKPYPCPQPGCERRFSNSSDRKKHQRSHEVRM